MNPHETRRTWSDEAKRLNRRRRLRRRIERRAPLLLEVEFARAVKAKPAYYGEGTALPPPARPRKARPRPYRTKREMKAQHRRETAEKVLAYARARGWRRVLDHLRREQRERAEAWALAYPERAAAAHPLFGRSADD